MSDGEGPGPPVPRPRRLEGGAQAGGAGVPRVGRRGRHGTVKVTPTPASPPVGPGGRPQRGR